MRLGFRAVLVTSLSLLVAIACVGGGENQCLNPQPDLPSCRNASGPGSYGGSHAAAGAGSIDGSPSTGAGGTANNPGAGGGEPQPNDDAGSSGDFAGAGGDTGFEPAANAGAGGDRGDGGAGGAAGSEH